MSGARRPSAPPAWLPAVCDGSDESVLLVDASGGLLAFYVSPATAERLGHTVGELASEPPFGLVHPAERARLAEAFRRVVGAPGERYEEAARVRHRQGRYVPVVLVGKNCLDVPGVEALVVRVKAPTQAESHDPVSHAALGGERGDLLDRVRAAITRAEGDSDYGFTLLIVELERMKMMVGNYGQETVDQLVLKVGARLSRLLRGDDVLARLGGGEFAIFLDGVKGRRRAAKIADRMQRTIENRIDVNDQVVRCSAVVGIATSERAYTDPEHVMRDASLALNRARVRGRRRRAVFQTQMRVEDARFMALVAELHHSIHKDQMAVHYQPVVSLEDGHLVGFEALLRWRHPSFGMVSPAQFIPIAEETGLIGDIGRWVLGRACEQMAQWSRDAAQPLTVSVNVSAKQLAEDLPARVEEALERSGLPPEQLSLELTESAVLDNRAQAVAALTRVKERGVRLSLDDFGTGYSSFSYLHQLPYDTLKIDRSFIGRLGAEGDASDDIVHAIIVLAHNLKMSVVAEGVELPGQLEALRTMFCGYAQGFHFARPLDSEQAAALIGAKPRWT